MKIQRFLTFLLINLFAAGLCRSGTTPSSPKAVQPTKKQSSSKPSVKSTANSSHKKPRPKSVTRRAAQLRLNRSLLLPQPEVYKYNEPGDLIDLIPLVRDINELIPRQFSLIDHDVKLISNRMIITHEYHDSTQMRQAIKNSMITFSYTGGFGRQFSTRLDVPLFYSSVFGFSDWSRYPLGNYTMTISADGFTPAQNFYIRAITRF